MSKQTKLSDLRKKLLLANLPLKDSATQLVFGKGNPDSKVIFIGEAPGRFEDLRGEPFVGQAGKLLDKLLASIGINREDIYITNTVKYRPPNNRPPTPEELKAFEPFLIEEIAIISPEVIIPLGRFAMEKFLVDKKISLVHGQEFKVNWNGLNLKVIPMYHPSAALRRLSVKKDLEEDFKKLSGIIH